MTVVARLPKEIMERVAKSPIAAARDSVREPTKETVEAGTLDNEEDSKEVCNTPQQFIIPFIQNVAMAALSTIIQASYPPSGIALVAPSGGTVDGASSEIRDSEIELGTLFEERTRCTGCRWSSMDAMFSEVDGHYDGTNRLFIGGRLV